MAEDSIGAESRGADGEGAGVLGYGRPSSRISALREASVCRNEAGDKDEATSLPIPTVASLLASPGISNSTRDPAASSMVAPASFMGRS